MRTAARWFAVFEILSPDSMGRSVTILEALRFQDGWRRPAVSASLAAPVIWLAVSGAGQAQTGGAAMLTSG